MPGDLDDIMLLHTAGRYAHPSDASVVLPRSYGPFLDPLVLPADLEDGGPLPTAYVDTLNWGFVLNDGPVPPHTPQIYENDMLVQPIAANGSPVYVFNPAVDFEGTGHVVAGILFFEDPGTDTITWRGQGTSQGIGGPLITNPIAGFFDAFAYYGGWTLNDFDLSIGYETLRALEMLGVQFQWCFAQQGRTYREWLNEILRCFHTDYFKTHEGKLAIQLDRPILGLPTTVLSTIDADTDLEGTADDVEFEVDQQNIVNTLTVKRRLKWTDMEYTDTPTVSFPASVNIYGPLRGEVELPACYTDVHGLAWVQAFFLRYGFLPAIVRFTVRGIGHLTDLPGTYLGFLNPWFGWTQPRLLKVLNQEVDWNAGAPRIAFECFDCQRSVDDPVTLPSSPIVSVRRRVRTPTPTIDLSPPGPAANFVFEGSYRRIVLRWTAPGDLDYSHTEIWASHLNERATATFIRNGGVNVPPGGLCEETFEAPEGVLFYVWLMTVDRSGNGQNGGSGPSGGNWHPSHPNDGLLTAASLIPTQGIAPQAVSQPYFAPPGFSGVANGVTVLAFLMAPTSPQTGYFDMKGVSTIEIPAGCTLTHEIRDTSATGPVQGQQVIPNTLVGPATYPFVVLGRDATPVWGAFYGTVASVVNTTGAFVPFLVFSSGFELTHCKV